MKKKEKQHQQTEGWFEKAEEGKKMRQDKWFDVEVSFQDGVRIMVATRRPELRCVQKCRGQPLMP